MLDNSFDSANTTPYCDVNICFSTSESRRKSLLWNPASCGIEGSSKCFAWWCIRHSVLWRAIILNQQCYIIITSSSHRVVHRTKLWLDSSLHCEKFSCGSSHGECHCQSLKLPIYHTSNTFFHSRNYWLRNHRFLHVGLEPIKRLDLLYFWPSSFLEFR